MFIANGVRPFPQNHTSGTSVIIACVYAESRHLCQTTRAALAAVPAICLDCPDPNWICWRLRHNLPGPSTSRQCCSTNLSATKWVRRMEHPDLRKMATGHAQHAGDMSCPNASNAYLKNVGVGALLILRHPKCNPTTPNIIAVMTKLDGGLVATAFGSQWLPPTDL